MAQINNYLKIAMEQKASDLHLSAGVVPRCRIDGDLVPIEMPVLSAEKLRENIFEILSAEEREKFTKNRNLDKSYHVPGLGAFRANIFLSHRGIGAVFRLIPEGIPSMEALGLPKSIRDFTELSAGLVLVTGPTGSGKSTTLASLIDSINTRFQYHILTIEDPIEFIHSSKKSLVNQRQIGNHALSFKDALKYALREDPDVILVGEMRDLETISLAITAAETGHLVFGTLHTRGAAASIDRIIDSFPGNQQAMIRVMLSESLAGVASQALIKRADGGGRVAAFDVLVNNTAISNLIREGKTFQIPSVMQTSREEGMLTIDNHLVTLVNSGVVTAEEVAPLMRDPSSLPRRKSFKPVIPGAGESHATPQASQPNVPPSTQDKTANAIRALREARQKRESLTGQPATKTVAVPQPVIPNATKPMAPPTQGLDRLDDSAPGGEWAIDIDEPDTEATQTKVSRPVVPPPPFPNKKKVG